MQESYFRWLEEHPEKALEEEEYEYDEDGNVIIKKRVFSQLELLNTVSKIFQMIVFHF